MIAAGIVATAGQFHGHAIAAKLLLGRMMQSSSGGGIEDGKVARVAHVIRGQLHGRAEVVVVQQTSRGQAAQCCKKEEEQLLVIHKAVEDARCTHRAAAADQSHSRAAIVARVGCNEGGGEEGGVAYVSYANDS